MKAISVRPEYTFDIFVGEQTFEERTWQTDHRGDLPICASAKKEPGYVKEIPHNTAAHLAVPFPTSAACRFLDLPPVNLRNLQLHLSKNSLAS